jgi:transketolase
MRREFAKQLFELMEKDEDIVLITPDLGYGMLDKIRDAFPDRFYNVGAAEMVAMGMAVGMALKNKIPIVYSITPFLLYRPFEVIRNYIDHEQIPVIMVGAGRNNDYKAGISHDATDHEILKQFKNINFIVPEKDFNLAKIIYLKQPTYLNLKR